MRAAKKMLRRMLFTVCILFSLILAGRVEVLAAKLTMAIERFSIGGSFIMEPEQVEFTVGETYADVLQRVLKEKGLTYTGTTSGTGFYLSGIDNVDVGIANMPDCVRAILQDNRTAIRDNDRSPGLYEFSYTGGSGWMYYVNNEYVLGMSSVKPKADDVARFMFTLYMGADLAGQKFDQTTMEVTKTYYTVADKTELVRKMGVLNTCREQWEDNEYYQSAYEYAVDVMAKMNATANDVKTALTWLDEIPDVAPTSISLSRSTLSLKAGGSTGILTADMEPYYDGHAFTWSSSNTSVATVNKGTVTPKNPGTCTITAKTYNGLSASCKVTVSGVSVGKAKISNVSSAAYNKLKITWGKASNATGYIVYRSTSKSGSYKAVKTINSGSTVSWTDSGLTTGKSYYYKVKALYKSNGYTANGALSAVKSGKPVPAKTTITAKAGKKKATIKWKKVSGTSGYVVYRATSKKGKYKAVGTIKKGSKVSFVNKKLTSKKTYYYKVRAYRTVSGKKVYGEYSAVKKVKAK